MPPDPEKVRDEIDALEICVEAFKLVDPESHERMLDYLRARFVVDPKLLHFTKAADDFRGEVRKARQEGVRGA